MGVSHFQLESIQLCSWSVSQGTGWPPSISGTRTFQCRFICFSSFLRFLLRNTVYQFQALCFGLSHGSTGLHLGHGSCFSFTPFSGYPYASIPRPLAGPVFLSGVSPRGLLPVLRLCPVFGIVIHPRYSTLIPSQVVQCLWVVFDSTSFWASPSVERILGGNLQPPYLCHAPRLPRGPVAVASRRSFFASSPSSGG